MNILDPSEARQRNGIILAVIVIFAVLPTIMTSSYQLRIFNLVVIYALFAIALNVVFGQTDQLFLFTGGLAGIAGYSVTLISDSIGINPWFLIPIGILLTGTIGASVSYIGATRDFSTIVTSIFTLTIQLSLLQFFNGARNITNGSTGFPIPETPFTGEVPIYYICVGVLAIFLVGYNRLIRSKHRLAFAAVREDELAAKSNGINIVKYKVFAGFLGSVMIGFVGILYVFSEGYITPSLFTFQNVDVIVLIILVLGGMRTLTGPVLGALIVYWANEILSTAQGWRSVIFGGALVILFLYFREGIVPHGKKFIQRWVVDRTDSG